MESSYGAVLDNPKVVKPVIRSLATLACGDPDRAGFGQEQLVAALQILQKGDVSLERMTGSWAGAMGHTQFIPTTYLAHAADFDRDGKRDIWGTIPDALASTANYLRHSGWRAGETWGYEVELPSGFDYALADETTARPVAEWARLGVRRADGRAFARSDERAGLMLPAGAKGPAFLTLPNFRAILHYNNANSYALAVGHLADRIRGGSAFAHAWPREDRQLAMDERIELQNLLAQRGYESGSRDGRLGPKSRAAIRAFQRTVGMAADGYPSAPLLERLRAERLSAQR
jgi:membrane-bound lytic murein transglycosylase B